MPITKIWLTFVITPYIEACKCSSILYNQNYWSVLHYDGTTVWEPWKGASSYSEVQLWVTKG